MNVFTRVQSELKRPYPAGFAPEKPNDIVVVKVGTNTITQDGGLDHDYIRHLSSDVLRIMSELRQRVILVSSGAVAAGKELCKRKGVKMIAPGDERARLVQRQRFSMIGQPSLMNAYSSAVEEIDSRIVVSQILLSPANFVAQDEVANLRTSLSADLAAENNYLAIINENDAVATAELTFGDNDQLAAKVAEIVRARLLVLLTDVPGIYTANPKDGPNASLIENLNSAEIILGADGESCNLLLPDLVLSFGRENTAVSRGGIASKLIAAKKAGRAGADTVVMQGKDEGAEGAEGADYASRLYEAVRSVI